MSIWTQKSALIQLRTSLLNFDGLAENFEDGSVSNLSTKGDLERRRGQRAGVERKREQRHRERGLSAGSLHGYRAVQRAVKRAVQRAVQLAVRRLPQWRRRLSGTARCKLERGWRCNAEAWQRRWT